MADVYFTGNAGAVSHVITLTGADASPAAGETWTVTVGDKAVIYTVVGTPTIAAVITALFNLIQDAIATGNYPEFAELSWEDDAAGVITVTSPAGVPLYLSDDTTLAITATETAVSGTFTAAQVTAPSGPNFANVAANWSDGAVPDGSDTAVLANCSIDILYGLATAFPITSVTMTGFRQEASYTGRVGLPMFNENGYEEYRPRYLKVGLDNDLTIPLGQGPGQGSSRLYLDFETADNLTIRVYSTGQPPNPETEALRIICNDAANDIIITQGSVGLAREPNQTSTVATVTLDPLDPQSDATFRAGSGCTLPTLVANGGTLLTDCALTTVTLMAGVWTHTAGAVTTIVNTAGTIIDLSNGTITAYTGREESVYDHRGDFRAKTFTAVDLYPGATWLDPNAAANIYTAGIDLNQGKLADFTIDVGPNRRITLGAVA